MAFLADDDKLKQDQLASQGGSQSQSTAPLQNQGGGIVNSAPSGVSSGAQDGKAWTNIQAYLNANKDNTTSAGYLNKEVGSQFDKDQSRLTDTSNEAKSKAQAQVDQNKIGTDQASQMIQDASRQYSFNQSEAPAQYGQTVNTLKNSLNAQYQGPQSYEFGLDAPTTNYGNNLKTDQGFGSVMNSLYDKAAGGVMSSGSKNLQQQLDTNNEALSNTRRSLLERYSSLTDNAGKALDQTNQAINSSRAQFDAGNEGSYKAQLSKYLRDLQSDSKDQLNIQAFDSGNGTGGLPTGSIRLPGYEQPAPSNTLNDTKLSALKQYNTIADILGLGDSIQYDPAQGLKSKY